jgi:hypothetical protein
MASARVFLVITFAPMVISFCGDPKNQTLPFGCIGFYIPSGLLTIPLKAKSEDQKRYGNVWAACMTPNSDF